MNIFVKNLNGNYFDIEIKPQHSVADVKRNIESVQGSEVYPADQQMLIHQGKVLKDETTLEENKVAEGAFVVVTLSKSKGLSTGASATSSATTKSSCRHPKQVQRRLLQQPKQLPSALQLQLHMPAPVAAPTPLANPNPEAGVYSQAASNLVTGRYLEQTIHLEQTIQEIMDMGFGTWDRDIVVRALQQSKESSGLFIFGARRPWSKSDQDAREKLLFHISGKTTYLFVYQVEGVGKRATRFACN